MKLPDEWTVFPLHPVLPDLRPTWQEGEKGAHLCGCGDATCRNAGKHPATPWGEMPPGTKLLPRNVGDVGIGLATGSRSGVVVIDLDVKHDGVENFAAMAAAFGGWPVTLTVRTPTGGAHLYFQWPGWKVKDSASEVGPGIDVRGDGGYVVLPDSPHDNGGRYEFLNWGTEIAPLPEWLAARLARSPGADNAPFPIPQLPRPPGSETTDEGWKLIDKIVKEVLAIPAGQRNERLFQKVAKLGDAVYVGFVNYDDARFSILKAVTDAGWGDPQKTADTVERALKGSSKGRVVEISHNHEVANNRVIELLAYREDVYAIGNALARDNGCGIGAMSRANLGEIISAAVDWRKRDKDGNLVPSQPPPWSALEVYDRGRWEGIREIEGFSSCPVLRADGSVAWEKGYDGITRVVIGETQEEVCMSYQEAIALLRDIVCDVEFMTPSHLGAWVCSLLTPLAMYAFDGPMPIFMFEGSAAGSGKTKLATITSIMGTGKLASGIRYSNNDEEMRKLITSHAMNPSPVLLFDDVRGEFGGGALSQLVTSPDRTWSDRVLGGNDKFVGKVNSVVYATINQATLGPDLERRICPIRITPSSVRPELRTGFKYEDWIGVVRANQRALTWAALTLLRGPKAKVSGWGSFEPWRDLVVGSVVAAGFEDPKYAVDMMREASATTVNDGESLVEAWKSVESALEEKSGVTIKQAWSACFPEKSFGACLPGAEKLRDWIQGNVKDANRNRMGQILRKYKDTATMHGRLTMGPKKDGYTKWYVR